MTTAKQAQRTPGHDHRTRPSAIDALIFALAKAGESSTVELNVSAADAIVQEFKHLLMLADEHQWLVSHL